MYVVAAWHVLLWITKLRLLKSCIPKVMHVHKALAHGAWRAEHDSAMHAGINLAAQQLCLLYCSWKHYGIGCSMRVRLCLD
jgi:hypothetical protein